MSSLRSGRQGAVLTTLALILAAAGCNKNDPNPFVGGSRSVAPPVGSAIVLTTNIYSTDASAPREVYAVAADGSGLTRLTFCNDAGKPACDEGRVAPAPDGRRLVVLRFTDTNRDGRANEADAGTLVFEDVARAIESPFTTTPASVTGIDWSTDGSLIVFTAPGLDPADDLFRSNLDGQDTRNLTATSGIIERHARLDAQGSSAAFERISQGAPSLIYGLSSGPSVQVTRGGTPGPALAGTPYIVGSDADPAFSPDGRSIVFRRLTALSADGAGSWDIMAIGTDRTNERVLVSGPAFRGAPDWGARGIVFPEVGSGASRLMVVDPNGLNGRAIVTAPSSVTLSAPRWLSAAK